MKITPNSRQPLAFTSGRKAELRSQVASFEATRQAPRKTSAVHRKLAASGFKPASDPVRLSGVTHPPVRFSFRAPNIAPVSLPHAELVVEHDPETEVLVLFELDAKTGEIVGWQHPDSASQPAARPASSLMSIAVSPRPSTVTFDIPLYTSGLDSSITARPTTFLISPLKSALNKVVQVFSIARRAIAEVASWVKAGIETLLEKLVRKVERKVWRDNTLCWFDATLRVSPLGAEGRKKLANKRVLLLVHGIISSTKGAFDGVTDTPEAAGPTSFYARLARHYDFVVGYDHWTLSKSTAENAAQLLEALPDGVKLDIICHSRGAGVVRSFLELPDLARAADGRGIKVNQVCFVAGACEGSDLATTRTVDRLVKVIHQVLLIARKTGLPADVIGLAIKLVLGGVQTLPGVDSMDPDGDAIKALAKSPGTLAGRYAYIRANYDPAGTALAILDDAAIDHLGFSDKANDVVVPFEGGGVNDHYLVNKVEKLAALDLGTADETQSAVMHTSYFENGEVRAAIAQVLGLEA